MEYTWSTYRHGVFASRAGLSLANKASFLGLGLGYKRLAAEFSYSILIPVTGVIVPGHALSVNIRFGDKDLESEYERLIKQEVKYRKDLVEALDESSKREGILRDELSDLKEEIDKLNASLKSLREQKAEVSQAREKLEVIVERQRRAEAELASLTEKRRKDKLAQLQFDFSSEWAAYLKMRAGGAPNDALKGALQRLVSQYQGAGIDISQATVELQKIVGGGQ
jgi:chromosome segregation ATPase